MRLLIKKKHHMRFLILPPTLWNPAQQGQKGWSGMYQIYSHSCRCSSVCTQMSVYMARQVGDSGQERWPNVLFQQSLSKCEVCPPSYLYTSATHPPILAHGLKRWIFFPLHRVSENLSCHGVLTLEKSGNKTQASIRHPSQQVDVRRKESPDKQTGNELNNIYYI